MKIEPYLGTYVNIHHVDNTFVEMCYVLQPYRLNYLES